MPISKTILEKIVNEMVNICVGFKVCEADPCLLYRENKENA